RERQRLGRRRAVAGASEGGIAGGIGLGGEPRRGDRLAIEPDVAVVDFQAQGGEGRAVGPPSERVVLALAEGGVPAPRLVAGGLLAADELVADRGVPAVPGGAAVLVHRQSAVIPVVQVELRLAGGVRQQVAGGLVGGGVVPIDA